MGARREPASQPEQLGESMSDEKKYEEMSEQEKLKTLEDLKKALESNG